MKNPTLSTLKRVAAAIIATAFMAAPLTVPAHAQTVDMSVMWPTAQFPKEGAFTSPKAAKKLPGEGADRRVFFFQNRNDLGKTVVDSNGNSL